MRGKASTRRQHKAQSKQKNTHSQFMSVTATVVPSPTQELLLSTLHWCFQVDTAQGLKCGTIPVSVSLLCHDSASIRGSAARVLYDLTTPYPGKEEACGSKECVKALMNLLTDEDSFVRSQATAALMR